MTDRQPAKPQADQSLSDEGLVRKLREVLDARVLP